MTLKLHNVRHLSSDGSPILDGVSFDIRPREIVTLLGRSGVGKSTLLNLIAGFRAPTSGLIANTFHTGYVQQECSLFPWLTVLDNVMLGLAAHAPRSERPLIRARCLAALERLGLAAQARVYPARLSPGERSRAVLAQTLVMNHSLILMDEPFAALDHFTRSEMATVLLEAFDQAALSVLFVTHSVEEAVLLSDRILVLAGTPARITHEIHIGLPRPRSLDLMLTDEFAGYRRAALGCCSEAFGGARSGHQQRQTGSFIERRGTP